MRCAYSVINPGAVRNYRQIVEMVERPLNKNGPYWG